MKNRVSNTDFIEIWQTSENMTEFLTNVTNRTGLTIKASGASQRAQNFRKKEVALKKYPRRPSTTNYEELKELALRYLPNRITEDATETTPPVRPTLGRLAPANNVRTTPLDEADASLDTLAVVTQEQTG
jgi:hypothetical protein